MELMLWSAVAAGVFLYIAKLYTFSLLLSSFPRWKVKLNRSPRALIAMDVTFGFLASHYFLDNVIGMIGNITFAICGMLYISMVLCKNKFQSSKLGKFILPEKAHV